MLAVPVLYRSFFKLYKGTAKAFNGYAGPMVGPGGVPYSLACLSCHDGAPGTVERGLLYRFFPHSTMPSRAVLFWLRRNGAFGRDDGVNSFSTFFQEHI